MSTEAEIESDPSRLLADMSKPPGFIRAQFWRGGTSNGVMLLGKDVPGWQELKHLYGKSGNSVDTIGAMLRKAEIDLAPIFSAIMGSPDPKYARQLNGMGGGLSSLSKAVIVDVARTDESGNGVDIDYCFVQIGIKDGVLDLNGNCGNMTSAVAPFAINNSLLDLRDRLDKQGLRSYIVHEGNQLTRKNSTALTVRLRNLNTMKLINAEIEITHDKAGRYLEHGNYVMDGVPGYGSPITLSFLSPAGAKTGKTMPTGNPVDEWEVPGGQKIRASLLDISNPGVFVDGSLLGWNPSFSPEQLNENKELMTTLESIRQEGARRMGINPEWQTIPKIVMLFPPATEDVDITCQAISMQQAHKAVPVTHALNLGVACKLEGTIAYEMARARDPVNTVIGHPSGKLEVGADISSDGEIVSAKLIRTARCLMEGFVNIEASEEWSPTEPFDSSTTS